MPATLQPTRIATSAAAMSQPVLFRLLQSLNAMVYAALQSLGPFAKRGEYAPGVVEMIAE